jgi:hypothetical protein
MPDAPLFVDGVIVAYNRAGGVGSVSLEELCGIGRELYREHRWHSLEAVG